MRIAIKISTRRLVLLDVDEIYFLESDGHDTWVRTARKTRLRSVRSLGELEKTLKPLGFSRVHKSYLVNLDRVREVRLRRGDDNDWELKLPRRLSLAQLSAIAAQFAGRSASFFG